MQRRINKSKKKVWQLLFLVSVLLVLEPGSIVRADGIFQDTSNGSVKVEEDVQKFNRDNAWELEDGTEKQEAVEEPDDEVEEQEAKLQKCPEICSEDLKK